MRHVAAFVLVALLAACDGGSGTVPTPPPVQTVPPPVQLPADDTATLQAAVDAGGIVNLEARTYHLTSTLVIRHSNTVLQGAGSATVLEYAANHDHVHCTNDRVITTPCDLDDAPPRRIAQPVAVGDTSFTTTDAATDLSAGEWLLINDYDSVYADRAAVDWVQIASVDGTTIHVTAPFRMAFTTARPWVAGKSGLGYTPVTRLVEGTELRNFNIHVAATSNPADIAAGISIFMALNTTIDRVTVDNETAQPLYSYLSKGLTITNSTARGIAILSEFGSTVDLTIRDNQFDGVLGLDLGAAFFDVSNNSISQAHNIGAYMLYGVHDGHFDNNHIGYVDASASASGLLIWGAQNVTASDNQLDGGAGPDSAGISVRAADGEIPMPSVNVQLIGNTFGNGWVNDYEPGTAP